jgi:hypothetical protein
VEVGDVGQGSHGTGFYPNAPEGDTCVIPQPPGSARSPGTP